MVKITSCERQQQLVSSVHTNDKQRGFDMSLQKKCFFFQFALSEREV